MILLIFRVRKSLIRLHSGGLPSSVRSLITLTISFLYATTVVAASKSLRAACFLAWSHTHRLVFRPKAFFESPRSRALHFFMCPPLKVRPIACSAWSRTSWFEIDLPDPDAPGRPALVVGASVVVVVVVGFLQTTPSPTKPSLHEQVKLPGVLVQIPLFLLQLLVFLFLHSLISLQTPFFLKKPGPQTS